MNPIERALRIIGRRGAVKADYSVRDAEQTRP